MNALLTLVRSPLAKALGWTLVHSLWEGALFALLVGAGLLLCRPASARTRYALACCGMLGMLVAFAATLLLLRPAPAPAPIAIPIHSALRAAPPAGIAFSEPPAAPPDRLPWIVPFWMAGVFIFYMRTAGGWLAAQRLRGRGTIAAPAEWQQRLQALAARLRVARPVILLESCLAETPVLIGFLRPAILIPAGLLAGLPPNQLEAILLHELAHIRRHDYAVNLLQSLVEGLLFYHPAVWWLSRVARTERENCCDDAVVALRGDAAGYAAALAALEEHRSAAQPALAAGGGNLMNRIHRLLQPQAPRSGAAPVLAAVLLLMPVAVGLSAWQTPPPPPAAGNSWSPLPKTPAVPALPAPDTTAVAAQGESAASAVAAAQAPVPAGQTNPLAQPAQRGPVQPPQTGEQQRNNLGRELQNPYRKWLNEDVAYIISEQERDAFQKLQTAPERENFIEQFWLQRDPTPGTAENEFKEEHYRRIAYANEHFVENLQLPGWKTDRGRIYIVYGPPDELDDHTHDGSAPPHQLWRYRWIEGLGANVSLDFVDNGSGELHLAVDPSQKPSHGDIAPRDRWMVNPDAIREALILSGHANPDAIRGALILSGHAELAPALERHAGESPASGSAAAPAAALRQQLASLDKRLYFSQVNLSSLQSKYTESSPQVREAQAKIKDLKAQRENVAQKLKALP